MYPRRHAARVWLPAALLVAIVPLTSCTGLPAEPTAGLASAAAPTPDPTPDLASVRVDGTFWVEHAYTELVNHQGFVGDKEYRHYTLSPTCATGPCDVSLSSYNPDTDSVYETTLTFADGRYSSVSDPETIQVKCHTSTGDVAEFAFEFLEEAEFRVTEISGSEPALALRLEGTRTLTDTPLAEAVDAGCKPSTRVTTFVALPTDLQPEPTALPVDPSCEQEGSAKTKTSAGTEAGLAFENHTDMDLKVYWLDSNGDRMEYADLLRHSELSTEAVDQGYWFVVADRADECLQVFHAPAEVIINY